jgi:hypothetical protein
MLPRKIGTHLSKLRSRYLEEHNMNFHCLQNHVVYILILCPYQRVRYEAQRPSRRIVTSRNVVCSNF